MSLASLVNLGTRFRLRGVVLPHPEFFGFQAVIKIKKINNFLSFKIFSTFTFLHREFSVKENKYWFFFKLNDVVLLVMHSCHMHSIVECENLSKRVLSSKVLPGNFWNFLDSFPIFPRANSNF